MKHAGKTPPFPGLSNSIAEAKYLRLGGVEQWVLIRGEDRRNPVLIVLHGGPGFSDTLFFRHWNGALEKDFTIVLWEQRGTGKSFDPSIPRESMTVEQFVSDLDELVDYVRMRVGAQKVVLFGHSWGSALGVYYAARFPEKVALYLGCAQVGDWANGEMLSYNYAVSEAERQGKRRILRRLRAMGPPPHAGRVASTERTYVQMLDHQMSPKVALTIARAIWRTPETSLLELPQTMRAFMWTLDAMWTQVREINLMKDVPELKMPALFFLGRRDHWIPAEASLAYVHALRAPYKDLVWFDNSAHEPFMDEAEKFNRTMVTLVRPLCAN